MMGVPMDVAVDNETDDDAEPIGVLVVLGSIALGRERDEMMF